MRPRLQSVEEHQMVLDALKQEERAAHDRDRREAANMARVEGLRETQMIHGSLTPMQELEQLIAAGWGDTPRCKIPDDWRHHKAPARPYAPGRSALRNKESEKTAARMTERYAKGRAISQRIAREKARDEDDAGRPD